MSPTNQQQLNLIQQQQQQSNQQYLMNEINRLRDELAVSKSKGIQYEEELQMVIWLNLNFQLLIYNYFNFNRLKKRVNFGNKKQRKQ